MSVSISKAILHILDTSLGIPVLSENLMSFNDEMREYTEKHIIKCYNDADLKKTKFTKFITDEGIEINIPYEMLSNREKVEFITNPDGTISIMLKNIDNITDK